MLDAQVAEIVRAAAAEAELLLDDADAAFRVRGHRGIMAAALTALVVASDAASPRAGDPALVRFAGDRIRELAALQGSSGLFVGGDNLDSPPDSAFTINAAVTAALLPPGGDELRHRLETIVRAAAPALHEGGVHTPNHRWELAAALARSGALLDEPHLLDRAREWLDEGIDVDEDGLYSERSPNYAARVSNPSLTHLADVLGRPDLHEIVHRNLHAHLDLTDRDGWMETVHSRRQDQGAPYPLGPFLGQLRRTAIHAGCSRCAEGAALAATAPYVDPIEVRAEQLLDPALAGPLPGGAAPTEPTRRLFRTARLLRETRPGSDVTVFGGSDVPATGRIGSGLACNPTFLRFRAGPVAVESVRLSRDFFGLGPFRAADMQVEGDRIVLHETVHAAYYQPLPIADRRTDGRYELAHEGRFAAAMSFSRRPADRRTLATTVEVALLDDGVALSVTTDGPAAAHSLEIALSAGGELTGATSLGDGRFELADGTAEYRLGGHVLTVGPGQGTGPAQPPGYHPGEAYTWTGGTDALGGTRLYVTWRSPGTTSIHLRARTTA
jgi:hypothetical protein